MDAVLRAAAVYFILLVLFRISGKRSIAQVTPFDFVLLLIVAEATQQAMLGFDYSVTNAVVVIGTLIGLDLCLSLIAPHLTVLEHLTESVPLVIVEEGEIHHDRLKKSRLSVDDILEAGRSSHGLERMDQIKYAILERSGGISVVPNAAVMRESRASGSSR